ncbi:MAG: hypothetical protein WBE89_02250, partial [Methyloceanibacter sp.]
LELGGVSGAEGRWLAIGPVQDGLRGDLAAQESRFLRRDIPRGCVFSNHQQMNLCPCTYKIVADIASVILITGPDMLSH